MNMATDLRNAIGDFFGDLLDGILEGLKDLFIPKDEYFSEKLNMFRSKFGFVDTVLSFIERLKDALTSSEFGSLEVDLSSAESDINYGGKVNILDVSWYARYKDYGDMVVSAILWVTYLYSLWKQLPGVISGASGLVNGIGGIVNSGRRGD